MRTNQKIYIGLYIQIYMDITTIRLKKDTKKKLRKFEIHPREIDEDIILRLMKEVKEKNEKSI